MPRSRSPDSLKAEKLYLEGNLLKDIAKILGVSEGTVRQWKKRYGWGDGVTKNVTKSVTKNKRNVTKDSSRSSSKKPTSAPRGNKPAAKSTAKRHKVDLGNQISVKHGAYSTLYWNFLTDDERAYLESQSRNADSFIEDHLRDQIDFYTIREMRIQRAIDADMKARSGVYVESVVRSEQKRSFRSDEEKQEYERRIQDIIDKELRLPGDPYDLTTRTASTKDRAARLEKELTSVQRAKAKTIQALNEILEKKANAAHEERMKKLQIEMLDAQIEHMDAQTQKLLGSEIEVEDTSELDELLYGGANERTEEDASVQAGEDGSEAEEND